MAKLGGIGDYIVDSRDTVTGGDATMGGADTMGSDDTVGGADEWMPTPWSNPPVTGGNYRNYYAQSSNMQMMQMLSLSMIIVVVLIIVVYLYLRRKARKFVHTIAEDLTSLKLAEMGWVLYTRPGCPWCEKQLDLLGGAFPATIVCPGTDAAKRFPGALSCDDPKVVGFPFWYNTKTKESRTGMQNVAALSALARAPMAPAAPCPPNNCAACATKEICAACK